MTPVRTCVGCGARDQQSHLVRFVAMGSRLVADARHRAPGRGAYLHRRPACWDGFVRRRGPVRSLRCHVGREERARLVATFASGEGQG